MPLSPAPSNNGEIFQHGLHHIVKHNANNPYPQEQYHHDEGVHLQSNYGSPVPMTGEAYGYHDQPLRYAYQQPIHQDSGLGSVQYVSSILLRAESLLTRIRIIIPLSTIHPFTRISIAHPHHHRRPHQ